MTTDHLIPEQEAEAPLFFGDGSGRGFDVAIPQRLIHRSAWKANSAKCKFVRYGFLRSSAKVGSRRSMLAAPESSPRVLQVAKIFGPAKPLPLRVAIASPSDKPRSRHYAGACG